MGNHETKPTWPQIRDALEVDEDRLLSTWLTGRFVTPTKEVTQESDVDGVHAFDYNGHSPETIEVSGSTRERLIDTTIAGKKNYLTIQ